jgi:antitoxin (DNA-binding transcriptional repressor) of toxin-antitoxin stability system
MSAQPEITQRDLRNRSREIMDAVERGQAFTVTRDAMSRGAPSLDLEAFRADQELALDHLMTDPYER